MCKMTRNFKIISTILIGLFVFNTCFTFSFGLSKSCSKDEYISQQIVQNSKSNGYTFWTLKTVNDRFDWLGGDLKSELYALGEPWCAIESDKYNFSFFFTNSKLNSSFVFAKDYEKIPVNIFASPSPGALNHLNIKLKSGLKANVRECFYMSESLYNKINQNVCNLEIVERGKGLSNINQIEFSKDPVVGFDSQLISSICGEDFIIINYLNSYDMKKYTGDSMFISVFKNDFYQNHFYYSRTSSIQNVYKNKKAYLSSYHDNISSTFDYSKTDFDAESKIQFLFENNINLKSSNIVPFIVFLSFSIIEVVFIVLFFIKNKRIFVAVAPFALVIGYFLYIFSHFTASIIAINTFVKPSLFFWTPTNMAYGFSFAVILVGFLLLISIFFNKKMKNKVFLDKHFIEVDI